VKAKAVHLKSVSYDHKFLKLWIWFNYLSISRDISLWATGSCWSLCKRPLKEPVLEQTGDVFGFCGTPFLQLQQCMTVALQGVAWQCPLSGILCQSEVAQLAVDRETWTSLAFWLWYDFCCWHLSFKHEVMCLLLIALGVRSSFATGITHLVCHDINHCAGEPRTWSLWTFPRLRRPTKVSEPSFLHSSSGSWLVWLHFLQNHWTK